MANALRGTWRMKNGKKVTKTIGICELLGLEPFTPHDLGRTAATLAGRLNIKDEDIARCLDHQKEGKSVTGTVYNHAERKNMPEKRAVLEAVERKLCRIIGEPAEVKHAETEMRLAA
jgi:hypothetical protein